MKLEAMENLLKTMATTRRLEIIKILLQAVEPTPISLIAGITGMNEDTVSANLSKLASIGLVTRHPSGRYVFYQINRAMMMELIAFWRTPSGKTAS